MTTTAAGTSRPVIHDAEWNRPRAAPASSTARQSERERLIPGPLRPVGVAIAPVAGGDAATHRRRSQPCQGSESAEAEEVDLFGRRAVERGRRRAQDDAADASRVPPPHVLGDGAAHRVPDGDEPVDPQDIGHGDDVVGAIGEAKGAATADALAVAAMVEREHAVTLSEGAVAAEEVDVGSHTEAMEQHHGGSARRTGEVAQHDSSGGQHDRSPLSDRRSDHRHAIGTFRRASRLGRFGLEQLNAQLAVGCLVGHPLAGAGSDQRLSEWRVGADHVEVALALLDVADEVALCLRLVVALVDDGDDAAGTDDAVAQAGRRSRRSRGDVRAGECGPPCGPARPWRRGSRRSRTGRPSPGRVRSCRPPRCDRES